MKKLFLLVVVTFINGQNKNLIPDSLHFEMYQQYFNSNSGAKISFISNRYASFIEKDSVEIIKLQKPSKNNFSKLNYNLLDISSDSIVNLKFDNINDTIKYNLDLKKIKLISYAKLSEFDVFEYGDSFELNGFLIFNFLKNKTFIVGSEPFFSYDFKYLFTKNDNTFSDDIYFIDLINNKWITYSISHFHKIDKFKMIKNQNSGISLLVYYSKYNTEENEPFDRVVALIEF